MIHDIARIPFDTESTCGLSSDLLYKAALGSAAFYDGEKDALVVSGTVDFMTLMGCLPAFFWEKYAAAINIRLECDIMGKDVSVALMSVSCDGNDVNFDIIAIEKVDSPDDFSHISMSVPYDLDFVSFAVSCDDVAEIKDAKWKAALPFADDDENVSDRFAMFKCASAKPSDESKRRACLLMPRMLKLGHDVDIDIAALKSGDEARALSDMLTKNEYDRLPTGVAYTRCDRRRTRTIRIPGAFSELEEPDPKEAYDRTFSALMSCVSRDIKPYGAYFKFFTSEICRHLRKHRLDEASMMLDALDAYLAGPVYEVYADGRKGKHTPASIRTSAETCTTQTMLFSRYRRMCSCWLKTDGDMCLLWRDSI